ncbi:MAG TPA: 3-isopropylmalate dehydratase small subunit [Stellaceae bacterium]|nr:3-isopropylmalate dehydratase small subunit [Stellaceae bacterium]
MTPFVSLEAAALPIAQPNFDTDQIIPARFLSRDRELGLAECLFRDLRFAPDGSERPEFPLNKPEFRAARIVVGEKNFACGSSRENAVWALADYGFRAAIAPSFGDIFRNNCLKNGVLPVALPAAVVTGLIETLQATPGARVAIDLPSQTVTLPDGSQHRFEIDPFAKHCLLNGVDELAFTLSQVDEIAAFENRYGRENI